MRCWNHVVCSGDWHGVFDFAHEGVDGGVDAEGFFDDVLEEWEFFEIAVLQRGRSEPRALVCSLYSFSVISGSEARRSMIQQLIADEECWPAMRRVIIIWAISLSGIGVPSLYTQRMRFQIISFV